MPVRLLRHQVASLKKQHSILSSEAERAAAALEAAQAEAAELKASLEAAAAKREELSKAGEASTAQVESASMYAVVL